VLDAIMLQHDLLRRGERVVVSHHFQVAAVAGALLINYHHTIKRLLLSAKPRQANHQHEYSNVGPVKDLPEPFPNLRRQIAEWKPTGQLHLTELFAHEATRESLHHLLCLPVLL